MLKNIYQLQTLQNLYRDFKLIDDPNTYCAMSSKNY